MLFFSGEETTSCLSVEQTRHTHTHTHTHLSTVSDVDDDVSLLVKQTVVQGRQVRRVVGVAAVGLDDGERHRMIRDEDDLTTLIQLHEPWGGRKKMVLRERNNTGMIGGERGDNELSGDWRKCKKRKRIEGKEEEITLKKKKKQERTGGHLWDDTAPWWSD